MKRAVSNIIILCYLRLYDYHVIYNAHEINQHYVKDAFIIVVKFND